MDCLQTRKSTPSPPACSMLATFILTANLAPAQEADSPARQHPSQGRACGSCGTVDKKSSELAHPAGGPKETHRG